MDPNALDCAGAAAVFEAPKRPPAVDAGAAVDPNSPPAGLVVAAPSVKGLLPLCPVAEAGAPRVNGLAF